MAQQSLFRKLTNKALAQIALEGSVLDLGGGRDASYHALFKGSYKITTVNINPEVHPDILFDLEQAPLPIEKEAYNHVLLINTLEHIYHYRELLGESCRVLKKGGGIVIIVPFLYYIHPSPHDYFRYTEESLRRILSETGFSDVTTLELGEGPLSVMYHTWYRFCPFFLNFFFERAAVLGDKGLRALSRFLRKKYAGVEYPLGYIVTGKRG
jgi:SAM-dependent methyltransferase